MSGVYNPSSTCSTPKSKSVTSEMVMERPQTPSGSCNLSSPTTPPNCLLPPLAHLANAPKRLSQRKYARPIAVIPMKSL
ncbi:unnamed protein product [Auanema sp. JU1783]|nr:unnamed protein product [Auanema sp. JU1783]